jgi:hypothetical protein
MRIFQLRCPLLSLLAGIVLCISGMNLVGAEKQASFKLYLLNLQFSLSTVYNQGGAIQQWGFTTAGATNQPYGFTNGLLSTEFSPTTRNFSAGSNTFVSDFIIYDYTAGFTRVASYGNFSAVLPTRDQSGPLGVADGIPDIFQQELAYQHTTQATAAERFNWNGMPQSGAVSLFLTRPAGTNLGNYQIRYGSPENLAVVNGSMRISRSAGSVFYDSATGSFRFQFDNSSTGTSAFTVSNTNNFNINAFTLNTANDASYPVQNIALTRSGKTYIGLWESADGNLSTPYRDMPYCYLVVSDNNDTDSDGVPDLTDPFTAPTITAHPQSRTVNAGATVTFTGNATGYPNVQFQWKKNGASIAGATASALTLNSVQVSHAGSYQLVASNLAGSATSSAAQLIVCNYTFSPAQPVFNAPGGTMNVLVSASGGCAWTVQNTNGWLLLGNSSGNGTGYMTVTARANTNDLPRLGYLRIGNKTLQIFQRGQLAPRTLFGRVFTMTVTNASGALPTSGKFQLSGSRTNKQYTARVISGSTPLTQGKYLYQRHSASGAILTLTNGVQVYNAQLAFVSPSTGSFKLTAPGGAFQTGTFVLNSSRSDFNLDQGQDLLWQNTNRVLFASLMNGTNLLSKSPLRNGVAPTSDWKVFATADVNNDNHSDLLLQHDTGKLFVWYMMRTNLIGNALLRNGTAPPAGWKAVAAADFNADDQADILFQDANRKAYIWHMRGTNWISTANVREGVAAAVGWRIIGTSDFNDDGNLDILWQHDDGRLSPWHMVGTTMLSSTTLRNGLQQPGWKAVSINDFNRDGRNDVLLQNGGGLVVWYMNGGTFLNSAPLPSSTVGGTIIGPR